MKFGLSEAQHRYIETEVVAPLHELGLKVFCYGSRARGDHKPFSDLDLMIEGSPVPGAQRLVSELREKLSQGNFPFKVDLVFLDEFAASYRPGYLNDKVEWRR